MERFDLLDKYGLAALLISRLNRDVRLTGYDSKRLRDDVSDGHNDDG